jgi:tellurite resistance protein TerC
LARRWHVGAPGGRILPDESATLEVPLTAWLVLAVVVAVGVAIDLIGHRGDRGQGRTKAALWSAAWIGTALAFGAWIAIRFGRGAAEDYLTAFLVEKSLSVDNLFVFLIVFGRLRIPAAEQHRVLQWGIIGAFVTRGLFIAGGSALLASWHGVVYVLGAFLIFTGYKTARDQGSLEDDVGKEGKLLPFLRRHLPFTPRLDGHRFLSIENGRRVATPLLLALIVIEITDVIFAVDSIPAAFAITTEPFIVYSSNIFALLGLRALYSVLADLLADLKYLRYGLGGILAFAGAKMLASDVVHVPRLVSLLAIVCILAAAVVPSVVARRRHARRDQRTA